MIEIFKSPLFIVICTQLLFTSSDLLARYYMRGSSFSFSTFFSAWFFAYFLIRQVAMFGQLYVFSQVELGKTMALFGATSIVVSNVLGFFLLAEQLSPSAYLAVALAVTAFLVLAFFS